MKAAPQGDACQGRGVPDASPVRAGGVAGTVVGRRKGVTRPRPCYRAGCFWEHQAGGRRENQA
jgi:hypothetical protein